MNKSPMLMPFALLIAGGIAVLVMATSLMVPAQPVWADLPPRPTPGEWRGEELEKTTIELRVRFEDAQQAARWQELWTVVEWQDAFGDWHEVEGWKGALDERVDSEARKAWGVSPNDLGKGPFRWTIYRGPAGKLLAHTQSFYLPHATGQTTTVSVTLGVSGSATSDPLLEVEYVGSGGPAIELRVRFGGAWQAARWQELWTVVEWQDAFGDWHEVEGWRGALDEVARGEGRKVWWVSLDDLGKGPFRWTVCRRPAGRPLAHSKPFHLPGTGEERVVVGVALGP
jgi:hypothetical protein